MSNQVFDNKVLENRLESILDTKIDFNRFLHADNSLAESAGMKKEIHKYKAVGQVDEVAMGEGNSHDFESSFTTEVYEVGTTQARGKYYDEEAMKDPMVVETIVKGMAEEMVNDFTGKAIAEMKKSANIVECDFASSTSNYLFDKVVDALAIIDQNNEDEAGYTLIISPKQQALARKQLGDNLKYVEGYVRTGYIGSVCGIPVVMSKACPDSAAFIVNPEAITLFVKKGAESEQERDANTRQNILYLRKVCLVALTNEKYLVELAKAQTAACAITSYTKAQKAVSGTCGSDCYKVEVKIEDDSKLYVATPSAGAWTFNADANLVAGKKINATAYAYGYAPKAATEVTVAN